MHCQPCARVQLYSHNVGWGVHCENRPPEATELPGIGMSADASRLAMPAAGYAYAFVGYRKMKIWKMPQVLSPGKVPSISGSDLERLKKRLQEPSGFQSYGQIQQWFKSELGLCVAYITVYEIVRKRLGAKLKVPRPQSTRQHPQNLSHFKKNCL